MKLTEKQVEEARDKLRESLKPGQRIYTVQRYRGRGLTSSHSLIAIAQPEGSAKEFWPWDISGFAARAMGCKLNYAHGGISTTSDGFDLVYELGRVLWPGGDGVYVSGRNGSKLPEDDGGYLLRHCNL